MQKKALEIGVDDEKCFGLRGSSTTFESYLVFFAPIAHPIKRSIKSLERETVHQSTVFGTALASCDATQKPLLPLFGEFSCLRGAIA
jgi:hypothetical protein